MRQVWATTATSASTPRRLVVDGHLLDGAERPGRSAGRPLGRGGQAGARARSPDDERGAAAPSRHGGRRSPPVPARRRDAALPRSSRRRAPRCSSARRPSARCPSARCPSARRPGSAGRRPRGGGPARPAGRQRAEHLVLLAELPGPPTGRLPRGPRPGGAARSPLGRRPTRPRAPTLTRVSQVRRPEGGRRRPLRRRGALRRKLSTTSGVGCPWDGSCRLLRGWGRLEDGSCRRLRSGREERAGRLGAGPARSP